MIVKMIDYLIQLNSYNNYRGNRYQMDAINRRAFFLKKYNKRSSHLSPDKQHSIHLQTTYSKPSITTKQLHNIVVMNLPNQKQQTPNSQPRKPYLITQSLNLKQKDVLLKVVKGKTMKQTQKTQRRWKSFNEKHSMMFTKRKFSQADSLQLKLNKPTDKVFHQLQNIRLAERLLFAKPSKDISNSTLTSFYQNQRQYKSNISRMPSHLLHPKSQKKQRIWFQNRKWVD